jgi:hypothetical protein
MLLACWLVVRRVFGLLLPPQNEQVSEQSAKVTLLRELAKEKMLPQTLGLTRNHEDVLDLRCVWCVFVCGCHRAYVWLHLC